MQLRLSPSHLVRKSRERRKYRTARKTDRIWTSLHRTNMAGMLPGVGVPQRRKIISKQHRQDSPCSRCESPLTDLREPLATCISDLDENALRARRRLEQKLASLHPRSRLACKLYFSSPPLLVSLFLTQPFSFPLIKLYSFSFQAPNQCWLLVLRKSLGFWFDGGSYHLNYKYKGGYYVLCKVFLKFPIHVMCDLVCNPLENSLKS